jgi:hypothetical protein
MVEVTQALVDLAESVEGIRKLLNDKTGRAEIAEAIRGLHKAAGEKDSAEVAKAILALAAEIRASRPAEVAEFDVVSDVSYDEDGRVKTMRHRRVPKKT